MARRRRANPSIATAQEIKRDLAAMEKLHDQISEELQELYDYGHSAQSDRTEYEEEIEVLEEKLETAEAQIADLEQELEDLRE